MLCLSGLDSIGEDEDDDGDSWIMSENEDTGPGIYKVDHDPSPLSDCFYRILAAVPTVVAYLLHLGCQDHSTREWLVTYGASRM
jgi:hypothetical protein